MKLLWIVIGMMMATTYANYMEKAGNAYADGEYTKSIALYQKAVKSGENPTLAYFNIGNAYFQMDKVSESIVYYRLCVSTAPSFFRGYLNLGIAYYNVEAYSEAIATLKRALQLKPDEKTSLDVLAASYRAMNALDKAGALYEYIVEKFPDNNDAYVALGEIYVELGDNKMAEQWLLRYPVEGGNLYYTYLLLADIYEATDKLDRSLFYLQQAFKLKESNKWLYYRIVQLIKKMGSDFVVLEETDKGLRYFPDFHELAVFAGNVAFEMEAYDRAERYYRLASEKGSASALIGLENVRIMLSGGEEE